ncbi:hypothetical protein [Pseudomonas sp. MF6768]|uniref:hypothetical protein n=1 Tax=Pseudomonas sp. MF6768 TaxID=2797532 RepID=UPI0018E76FD6|nr:hypothetical protein [Pseudomonas sp. MF6768]MBJ2240572.1 hypothetical protein [Pseudomonas sp. MF6768]
MALCALIYEAYVLNKGNEIDIAGLTYGIIDGKEFDGELHQTLHILSAWIDDMGIGVKDIQGHEYMILSFDDKAGSLLDSIHALLALSFLHDKPASVTTEGDQS